MRRNAALRGMLIFLVAVLAATAVGCGGSERAETGSEAEPVDRADASGTQRCDAPASGWGLRVVFEAEPTVATPAVDSEAVADAVAVLCARLQALDVDGAIAGVGANHIEVRLPRGHETDRVLDVLGSRVDLRMYDWEPNVLGDQGPDAPYAGPDALFEAVQVAAAQQPRAEAEDIPPGGPSEEVVDRYGADERKIRTHYDRANDTHAGRYYRFGSDRRLIAEAGSRSALTRAGGSPADSQVLVVPRGIVVVEGERAPNQPEDVQTFFVVEDDSELSGSDIENPEQNFDQRTNEPIVTMELTDEGRRSFARVTQRIAERGQSILLGPGADPEQALQRFAITLDDEIVSRATIDFRENPQGIDGRTGAQINAIGSIQETQDLAEILGLPPLEVDLRLVETTSG